MDVRAKKKNTRDDSIDPDDAPELTKEWFEQSEIWHGKGLIRPARPKSAPRKAGATVRKKG